MTESDEQNHLLADIISTYEPIGPASKEYLTEIGRKALDGSPSKRCDAPVARAAISIEAGELSLAEQALFRMGFLTKE